MDEPRERTKKEKRRKRGSVEKEGKRRIRRQEVVEGKMRKEQKAAGEDAVPKADTQTEAVGIMTAFLRAPRGF